MRKRHTLFATGVAAALLLPLHFAWATGAEGIAGSVHDFIRDERSTDDLDSNPHLQGDRLDQACGACHGPSDARRTRRPSLAASPWSVALTDRLRFASYGEPADRALWQAQTGNNAPAGVSKMCLSCHDGVLAENRLMGESSSDADESDRAATGGSRRSGSSLAKSHPISVDLGDRTAAATDRASGESHAGRIECSTCHDVHESPIEPPAVAKHPATQPSAMPLPAAIDEANIQDHGDDGDCMSCHDK